MSTATRFASVERLSGWAWIAVGGSWLAIMLIAELAAIGDAPGEPASLGRHSALRASLALALCGLGLALLAGRGWASPVSLALVGLSLLLTGATLLGVAAAWFTGGPAPSAGELVAAFASLPLVLWLRAGLAEREQRERAS